jgi:hypothetical protein
MSLMLMIRRWIIYKQRHVAIKRGKAVWSAPPPVARELAPARLRSSRKTGQCGLPGEMQEPAAQASKSKLPHHKRLCQTEYPAQRSSLWERACSRRKHHGSRAKHAARTTSSLAPTDPDRRPSGNPRILAPLPTTTPESAGLCALFLGSIVVLPLPISGRV